MDYSIAPQVKQYGGVISPSNLEAMRAQKISDVDIAHSMAQADPHFASQLGKIQSSFANDPSATSAFLNFRFYGDTTHTEPKVGLLGRIKDRIYGAGTGVTEALSQYQTGKQGAIDTGTQIASRIARGIMSPATESIASASEATGLNDIVNQSIGLAGRTQLGQDIGSGIKKGVQLVNQEAQRNPQLRSALDFTGAVGDASTIYATPQLVNQVGQGVGKIGESAINSAKSIGSGIKSILPFQRTATLESPIAKEAIAKGLDEKLVNFIQEANPDEKFLMKRMTISAEKGTRQLGGSNVPKQAVGDQLNRYADHIIEARKTAGKALSGLVDSIADKPIDLTGVRDNIMQFMQDKGVAFNEKGKIISIAGAADDEIPVLQKIADFLTPDENGTVTSTVKDAHMFRQKIFAETNAAKAKLAPTSGGQSVFSFSDMTGNKVRSELLDAISSVQPNYRPVSTAYSRLVTEPADYFKAIGYKGNLEDITSQSLRSGEVAMRTLGNASSRPTEAIDKLVKVAQDFGFESPIDIHKIIRYADELENLYPITPTRSLAGEVSRAGSLTGESTIKQGVIGTVDKAITQGAIDLYKKFRGMTPENRTRLLHALFDETSGEASVASVAANPTQNKLNILIQDLATQGMQKTAQQSAPEIAPVMQENVPSPTTLSQQSAPVNTNQAPGMGQGLTGAPEETMPLSSFSPQGVADAQASKALRVKTGDVNAMVNSGLPTIPQKK